MTHLSQDNEAAIIAEYFGSHIGKFVDIGCSGGVSLSNTFQMGLLGWHGLLVEASPTHFANLIQNYTHRGGFRFVNAAVWHERKIMQFNYNAGFYSSLIYKEEPGLFAAQYYVPTVIAEDLKAIQPECDLLSLDIESADIIVFPSLMESYPNCKLCVVEHAKNPDVRAEWVRLFSQFGLKVIAETNENYICAKI